MAKRKPRVYIETSVVSYLTARHSTDVRVRANQDVTAEWWKTRRPQFGLFVSEFVVAETSMGDADAANLRLEAIRGIPELEATPEARSLGDGLMSEGAIPSQAAIDAYHIAVATVNGMDYILTWNCAHIANAAMRAAIESVCRKHGYEPPIICTPLELMEG
ncbi:MAG: type II toxin-antitoxin system VapC family toxin [Sedimentisphaerales bacterium]|nr:type II toxin-antitoxin system VapC family toxin [Sedimentisphaerales bacterium]